MGTNTKMCANNKGGNQVLKPGFRGVLEINSSGRLMIGQVLSGLRRPDMICLYYLCYKEDNRIWDVSCISYSACVEIQDMRTGYTSSACAR